MSESVREGDASALGEERPLRRGLPREVTLLDGQGAGADTTGTDCVDWTVLCGSRFL